MYTVCHLWKFVIWWCSVDWLTAVACSAVCARVQIIYMCCDRLLDVARRTCNDETHKGLLFHTSDRLLTQNITDGHNSWASSSSSSAAAAAASRYFTNDIAATPKPVSTLNVPSVTSTKSAYHLQVINLRPSISTESFLPVPIHGRLSPLPPLTSRQLSSSGQLTPLTLRQSWTPASHSDDHISLPGTLTTAGASRGTGASPAERVAMAMACTDYPPEALAKVEGYKQKLNSSAVEWKGLDLENDAHVLSALMFDWIDELKVRITGVVQSAGIWIVGPGQIWDKPPAAFLTPVRLTHSDYVLGISCVQHIRFTSQFWTSAIFLSNQALFRASQCCGASTFCCTA